MKEMDEMKKQDAVAYQYLIDIELSLWSRFKFDPKLCCAENTNNCTESFNATLGLDRVKPILGLLEGNYVKCILDQILAITKSIWCYFYPLTNKYIGVVVAIRRSCMVRIATRQAGCENWDANDITLYAKEQVRKRSEEGRACRLHASGRGEYEVVEGKTSFPLDMNEKTCMCGKWQITGIPCKHACRIINNNRLNPYQFVSQFYSVANYKATYELTIHPMPDHSQWPPVETPIIAPPEVKRTVGRPPRNRKREPGEQKKGKRSVTVKCSKCKEMGHNKRACMGGLTASQKKDLGKGQKRKSAAVEEGMSTQATVNSFSATKNKGRKSKKAKK